MQTCKTRGRWYKQSPIIWPWNVLGFNLLHQSLVPVDWCICCSLNMPFQVFTSIFLSKYFLNVWMYKTLYGFLFYSFQISKFHWNLLFNKPNSCLLGTHGLLPWRWASWISNFAHMFFMVVFERKAPILYFSEFLTVLCTHEMIPAELN